MVRCPLTRMVLSLLGGLMAGIGRWSEVSRYVAFCLIDLVVERDGLLVVR